MSCPAGLSLVFQDNSPVIMFQISIPQMLTHCNQGNKK